nr:putative retrotransposon Orf1 [Ipomoea batatas]
MPPKSRRKECAKKRKHDVGSSSRATEGESDLLIPGGRSLRHISGAQIARVEELRAKGVLGGFYFDYPMLDAYGCREEVERMMTRRSWEHLFSWRDDTYEPVVHEFIATYTPIPSNHMWTPCMKFTLFGREHQVSLIQLGEYLGFYTPKDIQTEEWRNFPTDFDSDAAAEAYWHQITNGQGGRFTGTKPNTSKIVRPPLLMMKLLLNLTFGGRNKNLYKIYRFDLFNLWSMEMNEPIQMTCMVQQLFTSQTHPKCSYVWIGPVVTRLCHGLGLQRELAREKSIASMRPFTDAHLSRSYAPRIGAAPRPQQGEPPQEQELVVQGGPNVPPEYAEYPPVYDWASMRAFQLQLHNQSMNAFNQRMDLHHEELMRQNEAIARQNEAILRQNEAYVRQEERQEQQFQAIEQLRLWMEQRNLFSSPLSSIYGSPPPSPKGLPRAEMMVPRHTLERGEPSRMPNEDTSSEEGEAPNMEVAHRGLMIEVEDLFRQSYEDSESIFVGPIVSRLCEALGFEDALAYEAVATTMTPLDIGDFLQFGIAPEEPSEDEARGEQRDLWGIIERLENRVNMLEQEVRRLTLERYGEESDGSGI